MGPVAIARRGASATRRGALAAGLAAGLGAAAPAGPRRVVSLNPCLDTMLAYLADRRQIAALSHYARQPYGSTIAAVARTLPYTYESAEEVIALRPDLVLAARHSSPATRAALDRLGVHTELFGVPDTVAGSLDQVRRIARLVHRQARGEALAARIQAAIAAAAPAPGARRLTAVIYQPNGFAAGRGTLIDEMMTRTGFTNVAARYGLRQWGDIPLERLIADPPEVLLAGELEAGAPTWADRVVSHPALRHLQGRMHRASFPQQLLYCGGPVLIRTAAALAKARREALAA